MRKNIPAMMAAWIATTGIVYGQQPNNIPPVPAVPNWSMPLNPPSSKEPPSPVTYTSSPVQQQAPPGFDVPPRSGWNELSAPPAPSEMLPTPHVAFPSPYSDVPPCWRVCGWFNEDFMMVFMPPQMLPPNLVTDATGAQIVGGPTSYGISFGLRIDGGFWLDSDQRHGVQGILTGIFRQYNVVNVLGDAGNNINTTVTPAMTPAPFALLGPGLQFSTWSEFNFAELNDLRRLWQNDNFRLYGILGVKYAQLEEDVSFLYSTVTPGSIFLDEFHTRNDFWGVQLGLWMAVTNGNWGADVALKCAFGVNYAAISVMGSNTSPAPSNTQVLTNDANIGYFESSFFSVLPEVNANLWYQLTPRLQLRAGYNFLALTNIIRPGQQIVQNLDPAAVGGFHNQPQLPFATTTLLVHGLNLGASWRY